MEVNVHLNVKSNEVFDLMLDSLVYDIEQSTNQKVKKEDIKKGYTYEKYLTNKVGK